VHDVAGWQLAQLNIGRMRAPIDDPLVQGFVEQLDPINALADAAPGFVWRLQTEEGNATSIHAFDDDLLLVNLSVWDSLEALTDFVYETMHVEVLRRRREWFEVFDGTYLVLWWVPEGHVPTVEEAKERLARLAAEGPTAEAFTFRRPFPAPAPVGEPAV